MEFEGRWEDKTVDEEEKDEVHTGKPTRKAASVSKVFAEICLSFVVQCFFGPVYACACMM